MESLYITESGKKHFETYPIKGVLFDMDGVLIDTERLYTIFWQKAAHALGFPMTKDQALSLRSLNHADGRERFHQWFGPTASHTEIRNKRIELMNAYMKEHGVDMKAGVIELVTYLEAHNIPFAIATSSSQEVARMHLTRLGINDHFKHIMTAYDVPKGKPEPDIYIAAAEMLGLRPENCLAVEDSKNGLRSASRANTAPIMVPDQDEPDEEMWSIIAARAESLTDIIKLFPSA